MFVAVAGWGTVASFVPYLEKVLLDYSSILSLAMFLFQIIFVNFSHTFGLIQKNNYYTALIVYVRTEKDCAAPQLYLYLAIIKIPLMQYI